MHFARETRPAVADGTVTLTFRLWSRPQAKVGGRYRTAGVTIEVDDMELVPFASVTDADAVPIRSRRSGGAPRDHRTRGPVHDDTLVYRIEFHVV